MSSSLAAYHPHMIRHRVPRVCVPITGASAVEMIEKAETVARDNSFLEFRLDYLAQPATFFPKLKAFLDYNPHVTLVATCRRQNCIARGDRRTKRLASSKRGAQTMKQSSH